MLIFRRICKITTSDY